MKYRNTFYPIVLFVIVFLLFQLIVRVGLSINNFAFITDNKMWQFAKILIAGQCFDIVTLSYWLAPLCIVFFLPPNSWRNSKVFKIIFSFLIFILISILTFSAIAEFCFWEEFASRFNFVAVDYLVYTNELIGNIKESYPMPLIYAVLVIVPLFIALFTHRYIRRYWTDSQELPVLYRIKVTTGILVFAVISFFLLGNLFQTISTNVIVNELGKNGIYQLFSAFRNNQLDYDNFYKTLPLENVLTIAKDEKLVPRQQISTHARNLKPNVMFIVVESFGAKFFGTFGNPENITPRMDQLMKESLTFTNLYSTGNRTVRGLEALMLSIPPTAGHSVVRRPNNENLFSLGYVLQQSGYQNQFIYGGYGLFDNMNYFFENNHFSILDRSSFNPDEITFANVWGICDSDVFDRALKEADLSSKDKRPFFKFILTTSNHRPYTYPDGFVDIPSKSGRSGAVKYTDESIYRFIQKAKTKSWFDNTIFVIVADHSVGARGTIEISVSDYHIPLIIYAPKRIAAKNINKAASQIDIPPTLLNLMGISYQSKFFGKDILDANNSKERFFSGTYQSLGYFENGQFVMLSPRKKVRYYDYDIINRELVPTVGAIDTKIGEKAIANYQYASYLLKADQYRP